MAGAAYETILGLQIDGRELERLEKRLSRFMSRVSNPSQGLTLVATALKSQTKNRLIREKESPEGKEWQQWSEKYRRTRDANKSILRNKDHLLQDIASESDMDSASAFTSLIYGRTHQEGDDSRNITARPYLGLSKNNAQEIEEIFADWIERMF